MVIRPSRMWRNIDPPKRWWWSMTRPDDVGGRNHGFTYTHKGAEFALWWRNRLDRRHDG